MFRWCPINRRQEDVVVWNGKVIGTGRPIVKVEVQAQENLPRPSFKNRMIKVRKDKP